jgi:hypothetical protein
MAFQHEQWKHVSPLLCRPLLHALLAPGVKGCIGIELDEVKVAKARAFVASTLAEVAKRGHVALGALPLPDLHCCGIEQVCVCVAVCSCVI